MSNSQMNTAPLEMIEVLDQRIRAATKALFECQRPDGHWVFELEADATIPAEYVLMKHYFGETLDSALGGKIAAYLRRIQGLHGGWPLFDGGEFDMSASVKAYYALKVIGESYESDAMRRARDAIRSRGGAEQSNVFTRILLSLHGITSWRSVPVMPVEIMLLPRWFPFHLSKISYWARTVIVPLLVLMALKPLARSSTKIALDELFDQSPRAIGLASKAPHQNWAWFLLFRFIDILLRLAEPIFPSRTRREAIDKAVAFVTQRINGDNGLGAIFPAMVNAVMMFDVLGYAKDNPNLITAKSAIEKLLVIRPSEAYCQPCVSPVWDTALTCHALMEVGNEETIQRAGKGLEWLQALQVLDVKGDWAAQRPHVRPGGWAFQYANAYYPDLDDTAVVVMGMDRADQILSAQRFAQAIDRGREWIEGLQSKNGGWGAFDADNNYHYLNNIPFSDHGALLDPPTEDVTARCISMLAQLGEKATSSRALASSIEYLRRSQRNDGSWYGRWGINYIYGTWSVLCGLNAAGVDARSPEIRRAVNWLLSIQNKDSGWGEDAASYQLGYASHNAAPSTASQTAWALLGLMAAGEVNHPVVAQGIKYLAQTQDSDGLWHEERFTATGFPRAFYLRYHGYPKFFPLWAMARYRNLKAGNNRAAKFGM
jgi:squalene-hopene/tetraprenyl-beta-curcumene cyclase